SGASISSKDDGFTHPPFKGEVNVFNPIILEEVEAALAYYKSRTVADGGPITGDSVDLVLVDGGINDMGALNIVNLFYRKKNLTHEAEEHCKEKMAGKLLPAIASEYPNARIIVTGYFPLISSDSDPRRIWEMLMKLFPGEQILNVFGG